ncbi:hypothetical protein BS47DRAFT_1082282 [Hydnum rufescens UP504]|uniref:Uncharacterized protein n=1 Tax=Hydnum rufescens UP504 TaxID=1448309 RepID=A0A9P6DYP4_9AGAM|nr:hypothetical protein BS47DRAFT_1082282 [Hydnum rufescens UP504]
MLFTIDTQPSSDVSAPIPPPPRDAIMADDNHVIQPSGVVDAPQSIHILDSRGNPGPTTASSSAAPPVVSRICRDCAFEIFLHELYPWWSRERKRVLDLVDSAPQQPGPLVSGTIPYDDDGDESDDGGFAEEGGRHPQPNVSSARLPSWVSTRKDCEEGRQCTRQTDIVHAKEFNHIIFSNPSHGRPPTTQMPSNSSATIVSDADIQAHAFHNQNDAQAPSSLPLSSGADEAAEQMELDLHLADPSALNDANGDTVMAELTAHSGPIITPSECVDTPNGPHRSHSSGLRSVL